MKDLTRESIGNRGVCKKGTTLGTILDKINGKLYAHPPEIKDGKMVYFGFCAASLLIWGDGDLLFHFVLSKIVGFHL